jgi:hypothetical protein
MEKMERTATAMSREAPVLTALPETKSQK